MKFFLKMAFSLSFFAACSHAPSQGTVREEKNQANFAKEHSFSSAPEQVMRAAKMVLETGRHPGQLKDDVASPGGTTIAGLLAMEQGGVRAALMNAVAAATRRSRELGG